MIVFSLAFLFGVCGLFGVSQVPNLYIVFSVLGVIFCCYLYYRNITTLLLLGIAAGFAWSMLFSSSYIANRIPKNLEGKVISAEGYIASLPKVLEKQTSFIFKTVKVNGKRAKHKFKINWYYPTCVIHAGDEGKLILKLKKPRGFANPGGFDYEALLFAQGIDAVGYVVKGSYSRLTSLPWFDVPFLKLREKIQRRLRKMFAVQPLSSFLPALIIGSRQFVTEQEWEVLRSTGTNHLIAIAGLHIGFISALVFFIVKFLWRLIPYITLRIPAEQVAAFCSLLAGVFYGLLAGLTLPTQRACIMLAVILGGVIAKRHTALRYNFCLALLLILIFNPLVVLGMSFWLSFSAVFTIIYTLQGRVGDRRKYYWGKVQWAIALGILPFSLWFFSEASIVSPIANMIAVAWFGCIIVPLCFFGSIALFVNHTVSHCFLLLALKNLQMLWVVLKFFAGISVHSWKYFIPHFYLLLFLILGVFLLLASRGFPGRYLAVFFFLPLFCFSQPEPARGEVWFTMLDVGQGLSTVVRTQKHVLIYDAGPKFSEHFNAGESVVLPYLRAKGIKKVDLMMISHGDNDHIGGAKAILQDTKVKKMLSSVPWRFGAGRANFCLRGEHWNWDGVDFTVLSPTVKSSISNNNNSCVLRIKVGKQNILLTGDIEKIAEKKLIEKTKKPFQVTVLTAPHHGSKTSSSKNFIKFFQPRYVLYSTGYRNPFHFPHWSVIKRYKKFGVKQYNTVNTGALSFYLDGHSVPIIHRYRIEHHYIWNAW